MEKLEIDYARLQDIVIAGTLYKHGISSKDYIRKDDFEDLCQEISSTSSAIMKWIGFPEICPTINDVKFFLKVQMLMMMEDTNFIINDD